ncbi:MAG: serine--tRNA ligase, partial [Elusimicrobia bacterium]|nr:serine--tRNA ligase [Elusimicrobiota bacterium]
MIDPAIIRCEPARARSGLKARGGRYLPAFEQAAKLDAERRAMSAEVERLRAQRNAASQRIGKAKA